MYVHNIRLSVLQLWSVWHQILLFEWPGDWYWFYDSVFLQFFFCFIKCIYPALASFIISRHCVCACVCILHIFLRMLNCSVGFAALDKN